MIGNGSYTDAFLRNPPNDADDMAAALRGADFEVALVKNADSAGMETALADFAARLEGADTGLFYYAGHGVQADGVNYLIPISPRMDGPAAVKDAGLSLNRVVEKLESSGVRTALIFLDCCRNNPFPGADRAAVRGLTVVPTPTTVNSLVAYATSPGDTAADGDGRNGVFTGALLKYLATPGTEIREVMALVQAEVMQKTGKAQKPRYDPVLLENVYLVSLEVAARKAKIESDRKAEELADITERIAALNAAIAAAQDDRERRELERQQALAKVEEALKLIEAETARSASDKAARAAADRAAAEADRLRRAEEAAAQAEKLRELTDQLKKQLEILVRRSDSASAYIDEITSLKRTIADTERRYATTGQAINDSVGAYHEKLIGGTTLLARSGWESAAEYDARRAAERRKREQDRDTEIAARLGSLEIEKQFGLASLRTRLAAAEAELRQKRYVVGFPDIAVYYGAFDPETKRWPVAVRCDLPSLVWRGDFFHSIAGRSDIPTVFPEMETAIAAGALIGELEYRTENYDGDKYRNVVAAIRIKQVKTGNVVWETKPETVAGDFAEKAFASIIPAADELPGVAAALAGLDASAFSEDSLRTTVGGRTCYLVPAGRDLPVRLSGFGFDYKFVTDATYEITPMFEYREDDPGAIARFHLSLLPESPTFIKEEIFSKRVNLNGSRIEENLFSSIGNTLLGGSGGLFTILGMVKPTVDVQTRIHLILSSISLYAGSGIALYGAENDSLSMMLAGSAIFFGGNLLSAILCAFETTETTVPDTAAINKNEELRRAWELEADRVKAENRQRLLTINAGRGFVAVKNVRTSAVENLPLTGLYAATQ